MENILVKSTGEKVLFQYLTNLAKSVTGGNNIDKDDITDWFDCDTSDLVFEHFTDEQIREALSMVLQEEREEESEPQNSCSKH